MSIVGVRTLRQAMQMRVIRNEARIFMTRDQTLITRSRQIRWFYTVYKPMLRLGKWECFLLQKGQRIVGYGQIRCDSKHCWVTGIIGTGERGQGFGRELFEFLTREAIFRKGGAWLEVLASNLRARNLYESMGYKVKMWATVGGREILTMSTEDWHV